MVDHGGPVHERMGSGHFVRINMNKLTNLVLCLLMLLGAGCLTAQRVVLLDLDTQRSVSFSGDTPYWDAIVPTPVDSQFVYHMYRKDDGLRLVKRDLAGKVLKEIPLPLFCPYYTSAHVALRPDESGIAYHKYKTENLYFYDFATGQERILFREFATSEIVVEALSWVNNNQLVALLDYDTKLGHATARLVKIDADSGKFLAQLPLKARGDVAISPSGDLVAFAEMTRGAGIKIIDLRSLSVISEIPGDRGWSWMNLPAWLKDESELAYVDNDHWLCIFKLTDKKTRRITKIPKDHVCYFVGYPRKDLLLFESGNAEDAKKGLNLVDPMSGSVIKKILVENCGGHLIIAGGNVLAFVMGY